jgi:cytochrome b involved in lipid metabolism
VFLTVTTPAGEVIVIQAWGKDAAKAHKLAAQIQADSSRS